ncbi:uncharacterized protein LOC134686575 [Mytilus trossulus]|uniref:uncharacterized protein LOC134686575 n=1 Tax=Mytilus trossulus TaxID=6551 RepID=UPI003003CCC9
MYVGYIPLVCLFYISANAQSPFGSGITVGTLDSTDLDEASGLAASRVHPNVLYSHNDGGDLSRIFAVDSTDASVIAEFGISGADHYDWEDIAMGPCPDKSSCIYIADAGLNHHRPVNMIYRVREPGAVKDQTLTIIDKLPFIWTEVDGQTLLVDNHGEIYMVSNVNGGKGLMVHIPASAWGSTTPFNATSSVHLNITTSHHDPGAGDISPDGTELIIKARNHVYYWKVKNNDYLSAVETPPTEIPHHSERLGEAICWDINGTNYYTLSEGRHAPLYEFVRLPTGPAVG